MRKFLITLLFITLFPIVSLSIDPYKIKVVQTMIDSAKTQADLNIASRSLMKIWEAEVRKKQRQVSASLPKNLKSRFSSAMRSWKRHVEFMSKMRSELFKLDMMEPNYYKIRGIKTRNDGSNRANSMKPYVYNMSKAIYYEDKWVELDVLLNTK